MAKNIDIYFFASSISVSRNNRQGIEGTLEDLDVNSMIYGIGMEAFIDYFGYDKVLDEIGEDQAVKYFNITTDNDA